MNRKNDFWWMVRNIVKGKYTFFTVIFLYFGVHLYCDLENLYAFEHNLWCVDLVLLIPLALYWYFFCTNIFVTIIGFVLGNSMLYYYTREGGLPADLSIIMYGCYSCFYIYLYSNLFFLKKKENNLNSCSKTNMRDSIMRRLNYLQTIDKIKNIGMVNMMTIIFSGPLYSILYDTVLAKSKEPSTGVNLIMCIPLLLYTFYTLCALPHFFKRSDIFYDKIKSKVKEFPLTKEENDAFIQMNEDRITLGIPSVSFFILILVWFGISSFTLDV